MKCANCDRELPADEQGTMHRDFGDCWRNTRQELLAARKVVQGLRDFLWVCSDVRLQDEEEDDVKDGLNRAARIALAEYDKLGEKA